MKALHSFTAMLSSSSPLLLERACTAWRRQQPLQEELKHRNALLPFSLSWERNLTKNGESWDNSKTRANTSKYSHCFKLNTTV